LDGFGLNYERTDVKITGAFRYFREKSLKKEIFGCKVKSALSESPVRSISTFAYSTCEFVADTKLLNLQFFKIRFSEAHIHSKLSRGLQDTEGLLLRYQNTRQPPEVMEGHVNVNVNVNVREGEI
jgi:hypothetical protein